MYENNCKIPVEFQLSTVSVPESLSSHSVQASHEDSSVRQYRLVHKCSGIRIQDQRGTSNLALQSPLYLFMRSTLFIVVVHILLGLKHHSGREVVSLVARIVVGRDPVGGEDVRLAILSASRSVDCASALHLDMLDGLCAETSCD